MAVSSRLRLVPIAALIVSLASFSSSAMAESPQGIQEVAYQLHMVFFSHEAGLSSVIDPQMFVSASGTPAGTGPRASTTWPTSPRLRPTILPEPSCTTPTVRTWA
jgi:hypothetical protein